MEAAVQPAFVPFHGYISHQAKDVFHKVTAFFRPSASMYAINETTTILLTVLLTVLATLALVLRLLQANRGDTVRYRWHIDDYLCTAALVSLTIS